MNITVWNNFSKKKNSTKQPSGGTPVTVTLKENTSIENPVFLLAKNINEADYTYVQAFNHYYFVTDIVSVGANLTEVHCNQDVLATYKGNIISSSQFVERSASAYDDTLPDPSVSIKNDEFLDDDEKTSFYDKYGYFILSVLNDKGSSAGFASYYVLTSLEIQAISGYCNQNLADAIDPEAAGAFVEWIQANWLKTSDAIISCIWLPLKFSSLSGATYLSYETVKIGKDLVTWNGSDVKGYRITGTQIVGESVTYTNVHAYSDFRKGSAYTKVFVYLPFYGYVQVNPLDFSQMVIHTDIDLATGDATVYLSNGARVITTINYNVAVQSPVGKVGNQVGNTLASAVGTVGSLIGAIMTEGASAAASAVAASAGAINTIASAGAISPSVKGSIQGRSMTENGLNYKVLTIVSRTTDPANLTNIIGRPLMQYRTLSGLSGYVKCNQAAIDINGRDNDRTEIESYLNSGLFIE